MNTFSQILVPILISSSSFFYFVYFNLFPPSFLPDRKDVLSADTHAFFPFLKLKYASSYLSASAKFAQPYPLSTNFPLFPTFTWEVSLTCQSISKMSLIGSSLHDSHPLHSSLWLGLSHYSLDYLTWTDSAVLFSNTFKLFTFYTT